MKNTQKILNSIHEITLEIYTREGLYCLRGEKGDDYIINNRNVLEIHQEACGNINNANFNSFENIDNLLFVSDEIMYFTAQLFMIKTYLSNPLNNQTSTGVDVIFPFYQNIADKRFNMFTEIVFQALYTYYNHLALLLKYRFDEDFDDYKVNFPVIIDRIKKKVKKSNNYDYLHAFKNNEYNEFNKKRKSIVHKMSIDIRMKYSHLHNISNKASVEEILVERNNIPLYFKQHIELSITCFEKIIDLILE